MKKSKVSFEIGSGVSEHDKDRLIKIGWTVGYFSTFGEKYTDNEAEEHVKKNSYWMFYPLSHKRLAYSFTDYRFF